MPTLFFMPWCQIAKAYKVDALQMLPYDRDQRAEDMDELTWYKVRSILASHKTLSGFPVHRATLLRFGDKPVLADLTEDEREDLHELAEIACFSALAKREYFHQLGDYCNTDAFHVSEQHFKDSPAWTALVSRRRDGRYQNIMALAELSTSVPVHVSGVREVSPDGPLLQALVTYRQTAPEGTWPRWQNAISCFNQANTDSPTFAPQVEWVLLCSSFEHLLQAQSNYRDVAEKFACAMKPPSDVRASATARQVVREQGQDRPLRYEWMREFYRIRGDYAHGRLNTRQPLSWLAHEHLFLATLAFPLVVRQLLADANVYDMTQNDRAQVNAFEPLANQPDFMGTPPNQQNSLDSWWQRILSAERDKIHQDEIVARLTEEYERLRSGETDGAK